MENTEVIKKSRAQRFVDHVILQMVQDTAVGAALRRADNPATESQAWEYLAGWCDLEKEWERRPYALIGAAVAHAKPRHDGALDIGRAIAQCYEDGNQSDPAKARLRRLLACDSYQEACVILRPVLSLIASKNIPIGYGRLLQDLLYFGDGERVKARWAMNFYGRSSYDSLRD